MDEIFDFVERQLHGHGEEITYYDVADYFKIPFTLSKKILYAYSAKSSPSDLITTYLLTLSQPLEMSISDLGHHDVGQHRFDTRGSDRQVDMSYEVSQRLYFSREEAERQLHEFKGNKSIYNGNSSLHVFSIISTRNKELAIDGHTAWQRESRRVQQRHMNGISERRNSCLITPPENPLKRLDLAPTLEQQKGTSQDSNAANKTTPMVNTNITKQITVDTLELSNTFIEAPPATSVTTAAVHIKSTQRNGLPFMFAKNAVSTANNEMTGRKRDNTDLPSTTPIAVPTNNDTISSNKMCQSEGIKRHETTSLKKRRKIADVQHRHPTEGKPNDAEMTDRPSSPPHLNSINEVGATTDTNLLLFPDNEIINEDETNATTPAEKIMERVDGDIEETTESRKPAKRKKNATAKKTATQQDGKHKEDIQNCNQNVDIQNAGDSDTAIPKTFKAIEKHVVTRTYRKGQYLVVEDTDEMREVVGIDKTSSEKQIRISDSERTDNNIKIPQLPLGINKDTSIGRGKITSFFMKSCGSEK